MTEIILYLTVGFLFGSALSFFILQRRSTGLNAQLENQFKATAQEAVQRAHESFLQRAEETFKKHQADGRHEFEKRHQVFGEQVQSIRQNLDAVNKALAQSEGTKLALNEQVKHLHKETAKLAGALRNPAARGNWGEGILEQLLQNSGLIKGAHYQLQPTLQNQDGVLRPDVIVNLPDSLHIVIDAKAPISDFIRHLDEDLDEAAYKELQTGLAQAVRGHIQQLSKKAYWEHLNSPDFVVLFLPSEHLFSAAVQADPSLLDLAADKKIVIASPILTMSLLRVVGMGWKQVELAKNAQEISAHGAELYKRFLKFTDYIEKIGKSLQTAMKTHDEAVGSLQTMVLPAARKFNELQGQAGAEQGPLLSKVEREPRLMALTGEDEREKKRA